MYYGGWGHCNMVKMGSDLISIVPFEDGTTYKEVTPENYIEGNSSILAVTTPMLMTLCILRNAA